MFAMGRCSIRSMGKAFSHRSIKAGSMKSCAAKMETTDFNQRVILGFNSQGT